MLRTRFQNEDVPLIPLSASHLPHTCPIDFRAASAFTSRNRAGEVQRTRPRVKRKRSVCISKWERRRRLLYSRIINERLPLSLFFPERKVDFHGSPPGARRNIMKSPLLFYYRSRTHAPECLLTVVLSGERIWHVRVIAISNGCAFLGYFIATRAIGRNIKPAIKPPSR